MTREDVVEYNEKALFCDGLDEAIIGVAERINLGPVAAYSVEKIIEIDLSSEEKKNFDKSVEAVRDLYKAAQKIDKSL